MGSIAVKTQEGVARFRRAGVLFTREEQVLSVEELGPERVAAIKAESMLEVRELAAAVPVEISDEAPQEQPAQRGKGRR